MSADKEEARLNYALNEVRERARKGDHESEVWHELYPPIIYVSSERVGHIRTRDRCYVFDDIDRQCVLQTGHDGACVMVEY